MKKRIASVLLCTLMIATLAVPAFAAACTHSSQRTVRTTTGISMSTETQHIVSYKDTNYCNTCGVVVSTHYGSYNENHSLRTLSGTHNNNGTHSWRISCSKCGYFTSYVVPCSGPPCPMPFSLEW